MLDFNFKKLAKKKGVSLNEMHRITGVPNTTLNKLWHGKLRGMQLDTIEKIIDFFDVPIEKFIVKKSPEPKYTFSFDKWNPFAGNKNIRVVTSQMGFEINADDKIIAGIFDIEVLIKEKLVVINVQPLADGAILARMTISKWNNSQKEIFAATIAREAINNLRNPSYNLVNTAKIIFSLNWKRPDHDYDDINFDKIIPSSSLSYLWTLNLINDSEFEKDVRFKNGDSSQD